MIVPVLGAALVAAVLFQLWRTLEFEAETRALELDKAEVLAERILRRAIGSRAAFAAAAGTAFTVRSGEVVVDERVGWLDPVPAAADEDIVVRDRLERAARAEFGAGDPAAAARAFDELLAAGLPLPARLQVLAAAAWQARRAAARERERELTEELSQRIGALRPDELGRETVALAVAATLRLLDEEAERPEWIARVVEYLPGSTTLPSWVDRSQLESVAARRAAIVAAREVWRDRPPARETGLRGELHGNGRYLLWWQPEGEGSGGSAARWLPVGAFLTAVRRTGGTAELPEWPWLVEPELSATAGAAFGGVPFVRGVRPGNASAIAERRWLLPVLTLALLVAFGLVVTQQLRAQRREAEAVRAQAEFLTTVTHELKTPLASIRLLSEMLVDGRVAGREQEYYRMLASESGRLSMLIENVLDLGRLERGERAYDLRPCDVAEVVRETVTLVRPLAERDATEILLGEPGGGALVARVDRAALAQALISVLDNARKYGKGPIEVGFGRAAGELLLSVRDHGAGVPESERERIFERFARGEAHAHGSTPGVGIGLYLARVIARRLGGDLTCASPADGAGVVFTLRLPLDLGGAAA